MTPRFRLMSPSTGHAHWRLGCGRTWHATTTAPVAPGRIVNAAESESQREKTAKRKETPTACCVAWVPDETRLPLITIGGPSDRGTGRRRGSGCMRRRELRWSVGHPLKCHYERNATRGKCYGRLGSFSPYGWFIHTFAFGCARPRCVRS